MNVSAILVSGGVGLRMGGPTPKQYLPLGGKPIALFSYDVLKACDAISEIIVVCAESYRRLFRDSSLFANPGERRQDSVANGLKMASCDYVLVHDAARPFIDLDLVRALIDAGLQYGAATAALPIKFTVKRGVSNQVIETLDRSQLYEIQTPQILKRDLLEAGLKMADLKGITVTDDVSCAELLGHPVQLVKGLEKNIKITTPFDLTIAEKYLCEIPTYSQL